MRGEIRRWFWLFFAIGDFRHWQISPVEFEAVSAKRSILAALALAGQNSGLLKSVEMIADGLFALAGVSRQLLNRRETGPRLVGIVGKSHGHEFAAAGADIGLGYSGEGLVAHTEAAFARTGWR